MFFDLFKLFFTNFTISRYWNINCDALFLLRTWMISGLLAFTFSLLYYTLTLTLHSCIFLDLSFCSPFKHSAFLIWFSWITYNGVCHTNFLLISRSYISVTANPLHWLHRMSSIVFLASPFFTHEITTLYTFTIFMSKSK